MIDILEAHVKDHRMDQALICLLKNPFDWIAKSQYFPKRYRSRLSGWKFLTDKIFADSRSILYQHTNAFSFSPNPA